MCVSCELYECVWVRMGANMFVRDFVWVRVGANMCVRNFVFSFICMRVPISFLTTLITVQSSFGCLV